VEKLINMRSSSRFGFSRRQILKTLGLGACAAPLLPLLNATGQELVRPKRLILFFSPDGAAALNFGDSVDWKPQGTETDFTFHQIHAPLDPFKAKIVVPWGLTMTAGGAGEQHAFGMAGIWTGATLHSLVTKELSPYCQTNDPRTQIDGPNVMLEPNVAQSIGAALHELATNAAKFGSLSVAPSPVT
jgi:hypothetical protein